MRARIEQFSMGYHVKLLGERDSFIHLLETFKSIVPKNCRRFMGRYWFVYLRAGKKLARFIDSVRSSGGRVENGEEGDGCVPQPSPWLPS